MGAVMPAHGSDLEHARPVKVLHGAQEKENRMSEERKVRVAVIQEPPVWLDLTASLERAVALVEQAASSGERLVVFPEAWLPGYPFHLWQLAEGRDGEALASLHALLLANAVNLARDDLAPLRSAARTHGMVIAIGHQEIDSMASASTIYNSLAIIDADGSLRNNHRKLMPTGPERLAWGMGDGRGLKVVETAVGRIGGLICWENYMPLARAALIAQGPEIWLAPTWDTGRTWLATIQHIAREAGAWVIGASTPLTVADIPVTIPFRERIVSTDDEAGGSWINAGDAIIHRPFGKPLAGPMHKEKGLLEAEIDLDAVAPARRLFDAAGHYSRPDIFTLEVDRRRRPPACFRDESDPRARCDPSP